LRETIRRAARGLRPLCSKSSMPSQVTTVRGFCRRILERGDLETKLAPPPADLDDAQPGPALCVDRPARDAPLSLATGADRLPRPSALGSAEARARCLARFAHHELMAVELFAWALLRWPALDTELRRAFVRVVADEQRHCRMYLERLAAHGSNLTLHPRSDYFWKHAQTIARSPYGPRAFLCAMGLTLEQANLDFAAIYRDAFRASGDERSAQVCDAVQRDEVRHVALAARWLRKLAPGRSDLEAYTEAVPFPFAATRAKGRRFDAEARRRAGLSADFIEAVRTARSKPGRMHT
jgi:uncharacterized ferritin-like protein (DUF455 family)